jgi:hypothetical protein
MRARTIAVELVMTLFRVASSTVAVLVVGALFAPAQTSSAGQASLPPAREIVSRHLKAIGGEAALAAVTSMRIRGRLAIPSQRIEGDLEVLTARPAKQLYRVNVPNFGRVENGYNGAIGWSISPASGPELLSGRQLAEAADDAWFDAPLHAPNRVKELTTVAETEFDGKPAYKVRVVLASGNEQFEYYDVKAGLQIGAEANRAMPQGVVATVGVLRDYRQFGSLLHASTQLQRALGFEQVITITSCEYNVVPSSAFEPPAEVRALSPR